MSFPSLWIQFKHVTVCTCVCVCACVGKCWHWMKEVYVKFFVILLYFPAQHPTTILPKLSCSSQIRPPSWSILLPNIHWKYLLRLKYSNNFYVHLPQSYPGSNSSLHTTPSPVWVIFSSLPHSSAWYGTHHNVTWNLTSYAIAQCMNYWSISSLRGKNWDLFIFISITVPCITLHIVNMQQIICWEND